MTKIWHEQGDDWGEINEPWYELDNFVAIILDKIHILDILDKYEIEYIRASSGNFTHKLRCPFPDHLSGNERTASLCISDKNNDFYCFGCNNRGNVVTFMMLYLGVPYYKALGLLTKYWNITDNDIDEELLRPKEKRDPNHTVIPHIFRAGVLIKEFLVSLKGSKNYPQWCIWADKQFKRLDHYLDTLTDNQWETAKKYCDCLSEYIKNKAG